MACSATSKTGIHNRALITILYRVPERAGRGANAIARAPPLTMVFHGKEPASAGRTADESRLLVMTGLCTFGPHTQQRPAKCDDERVADAMGRLLLVIFRLA